MDDKRPTLEVIAPSIEEAIQKGLSELGLPEEAVEVEVLDQGSRGILGLGTRQARIRLVVKWDSGETTPQPSVPALKGYTEGEEAAEEQEMAEGEEVVQRPAPARVEQGVSEENELDLARQVIVDLLTHMKVHASVNVKFGELDEDRKYPPILVDVHGDDLSILIGRRAETLNAFQYIAGMIVSKELGHPMTLVVDVEGYRARREGQLRLLARRMAEQAVNTGKRQVLEPMPANERRIIHMELRDHEDVSTQSIGEEPRRKVTIIPKD